MTDKPAADVPAPFPSIPNATATPAESSSDRSYDELVRRTVPLPDSSHRPTRDAAIAAEEPRAAAVTGSGSGDLPGDDAVREALAALEYVDVSDLTVALRGGSATLSGSVARGFDRDRITTALGRIPGVTEIVDHLRIRTE